MNISNTYTHRHIFLKYKLLSDYCLLELSALSLFFFGQILVMMANDILNLTEKSASETLVLKPRFYSKVENLTNKAKHTRTMMTNHNFKHIH